ncbi:MAG: hypothetical protein BWX80_02462 [Candidatus Hydrogenedentes bacterium ADurb.Bin101]|nr:MAG: hypothetical protein BWX80_02462 [Candidatus Hydrogenedentes bacterium ADurb.Bin101]
MIGGAGHEIFHPGRQHRGPAIIGNGRGTHRNIHIIFRIGGGTTGFKRIKNVKRHVWMNISDGNRSTIREQRNVDGIIAVGTADTGTGNKEAEHIIPVVTADRVVFRGKDIPEFNDIPYRDKVKFERNGVLQIGTARPPQRRCKIPEIIIAVGVELMLMIGFGIGSHHFRNLSRGKDDA